MKWNLILAFRTKNSPMIAAVEEAALNDLHLKGHFEEQQLYSYLTRVKLLKEKFIKNDFGGQGSLNVLSCSSFQSLLHVLYVFFDPSVN